MSDKEIMINNYFDYIDENYRNSENYEDVVYDPDFSHDPDVELFIYVLEKVKDKAEVDDDISFLKIIFEELIKGAVEARYIQGVQADPEKKRELFIFAINNFIDFLDINNLVAREDGSVTLGEDNVKFETALIDICNGEENLMFAAVEKFNGTKNYDVLYAELDAAVSAQKAMPRLPAPAPAPTNFFYIGPYDPINAATGDYEPPYRKKKPPLTVSAKSSSLRTLKQLNKNTTKKGLPKLSILFEPSEAKLENNKKNQSMKRHALLLRERLRYASPPKNVFGFANGGRSHGKTRKLHQLRKK